MSTAAVAKRTIPVERLQQLAAQQGAPNWFQRAVSRHAGSFDVDKAIGRAVSCGNVALLKDIVDDREPKKAAWVRQAELNWALQIAVDKHDLARVKELLDEGASVSARSIGFAQNKLNPTVYACAMWSAEGAWRCAPEEYENRMAIVMEFKRRGAVAPFWETLDSLIEDFAHERYMAELKARK